jgi:predicted ATPase/class 3 adenylate cyclase
VQPEADVLDAYSWDDPEAYIPGDRRRALLTGSSLPDRVTGAALFADLSGFTPLTEAMHAEYGPTRGAEQLTATLATVFDAVMGELHRHSGSVVYFSGDAITCWLDRDDGTLAAACGLAMQRAMRAVDRVTLPSGSVFDIGLKIAVAVGEARRWVVGDPDIQLIDVLAGRLVDDLAAAEGAARPGDVVLDSSALAALNDRVEIRELRTANGRTCGVLDRLRQPVLLPEPPSGAFRLPDDLVRPWLLPPVWERLRTGRGEFLAELRPGIPFFVRFGGIDFDDDPDARHLLDDFIVRSQRVIDSYGGAALQLTLGDKGAYLYAVFGSPIAHEDDAARACAAALEVLALDRETAVTGIQIGIAQGRLRSGTYGHQRRRTFCCLGDAVNLAARLMTSAAAGQIVVAEPVQRAAGGRFEWKRLPELKVKGKKAPVVAFELGGQRTGLTPRHHLDALIGRFEELARINGLLDRATAGQGQLIGLRADAGMGKSRLVAEAARGFAPRGFTCFEGEAQPFGTLASYFLWRPIWSGLLGFPEDDVARQPTALAEALAELTPDHVGRLPLLGPVLGVDLPDTDLTQWLDPKLRKASVESLLVDLLRALVRARGPLVLVLEDCHWMDPLSADLLEVLARSIADLPVVLLLAYRTPDRPDAGWLDRLATLPYWTELRLDDLDEQSARQLIAVQADRVFRLGPDVPDRLTRLVLDRGGGNPFHILETLSYIRAQGVDPRDDDALRTLQVPVRLHALVLSRIDLLAERVRRTAKVASVIGRAFDLRTLTGAYSSLGSSDDVLADLTDLQSRDLVLREDAATLSYLFRHVVVRDVAYDSLPFAMRAVLHERVAAWLEHDPVLASAGRYRLDLLAHHYWHSDNAEKKRDYLTSAGEAAALDYANSVALDYFGRAAALGDEAQRADVLMKLGRVQELVGEWSAAHETFTAALRLSQRLTDRSGVGDVQAALAENALKQGHFDEAARWLAAAEREYLLIDDDAGLGKVLHLSGRLATQQGDLEAARERYRMSLQIRRRLDDAVGEAAVLSNLAIAAELEADYDSARGLNEQALALRRDLGDRWALGVSHTNLGMIFLLQEQPREAREHFRETLRLSLEVGDPWMSAVAHHNLANAGRDLGDLPGAADEYAQALAAYRTFDDRWYLAYLLEDMALATSAAGQPLTTLRLAATADAMRDRLGAPRPASQELLLAGVLAKAKAECGAETSARAGELSDQELDGIVSGLLAHTDRDV